MTHELLETLSKTALIVGLLALPACAEFGSAPLRMQANYGASTRNMVDNQIYDRAKAQYPAALAPDGIEGNKAERNLEQAYRKDLGSPQKVETHTTLGVIGRGGSGGGGGTGGSTR